MGFLVTVGCNKSDDDKDDDPDLKSETIGGAISEDRILENIFENPDRVDYIVDRNLTIRGRLTIEPGVRLEIAPGVRIVVETTGSLASNGTLDDPIFFEGREQVSGYWGSLLFNSNNPNNVLSYTILSDGGGDKTGNYNSLIVLDDNAKVKIENSIIRNSGSNGVRLRSATASLDVYENNEIYDCSDYPVLMKFNQVAFMNNTNDFSSGNSRNYVCLEGSNANTDIRITKLDIPYLITGTAEISANCEIDPGTKILMEAKSKIDVSSTGSLKAVGTANDRIVIDGRENAKGYWDYIYFDTSVSTNNLFSYVDINNGGGETGSSHRAAVIVYRGRLSMGNSNISNSLSFGLRGIQIVEFNDLGGNTFIGNTLGNTDGI